MNALALGTVQFGLDYGIKNERGRVPAAEVSSILKAAAMAGIDTLDTAAAYGESENALGLALAGISTRFRIVSKLPAVPQGTVKDALNASLGRLRVERLYAYLFHSYATHGQNPRLLDEFVDCRAKGLVQKIGFSLYRPEEAEHLLDLGLPFDLVQVPYNLFDRRFESVFIRLKERGVEIHVRSVFLQGLFFMEPEKLEARFNPVRGRLEALSEAARKSGQGIAALCLGFAARSPAVDRIVIGVDSLADLEENIRAFGARDRVAVELDRLGDLSVADEEIILPFNWKHS